MKIKALAILRSPELTADPGDVVTVDEKAGKILIDAEAAELVEEVEIIEPAVVTYENIVALKEALEENYAPVEEIPTETEEAPPEIEKTPTLSKKKR